MDYDDNDNALKRAINVTMVDGSRKSSSRHKQSIANNTNLPEPQENWAGQLGTNGSVEETPLRSHNVHKSG
jgi:hypothetical protein